MFSGIVEEMGTVRAIEWRGDAATIEIAAQRALEGTQVGDSVAVNGCCLTVTHLDAEGFRIDLSPETLRRSNLGELEPGRQVNLERSLRVDSHIGGHFVQGHLDGVGQVVSIEPEGDAVFVRLTAPPELMRYVVQKGFIAVDGISLTIVDPDEETFGIAIIPHTFQHTTVQDWRPGSTVNIEVDILGKYVERFLEPIREARSDDFSRSHSG